MKVNGKCLEFISHIANALAYRVGLRRDTTTREPDTVAAWRQAECGRTANGTCMKHVFVIHFGEWGISTNPESHCQNSWK